MVPRGRLARRSGVLMGRREGGLLGEEFRARRGAYDVLGRFICSTVACNALDVPVPALFLAKSRQENGASTSEVDQRTRVAPSAAARRTSADAPSASLRTPSDAHFLLVSISVAHPRALPLPNLRQLCCLGRSSSPAPRPASASGPRPPPARAPPLRPCSADTPRRRRRRLRPSLLLSPFTRGRAQRRKQLGHRLSAKRRSTGWAGSSSRSSSGQSGPQPLPLGPPRRRRQGHRQGRQGRRTSPIGRTRRSSVFGGNASGSA